MSLEKWHFLVSEFIRVWQLCLGEECGESDTASERGGVVEGAVEGEGSAWWTIKDNAGDDLD